MAVKKTAEIASKEIEKVIKKVEETVEVSKPVVEKAVKAATEKTASTAKKAAATAKKTAAKFEPKKTAVVFEANGKSYAYDEIVKKVTKACKGKTAKKLEIYVNANEGAAYYVLDGEASEDYRVEL